jgi:hypothetical protein
VVGELAFSWKCGRLRPDYSIILHPACPVDTGYGSIGVRRGMEMTAIDDSADNSEESSWTTVITPFLWVERKSAGQIM